MGSKKKVVVAMSGGVDSATTACLLLKQGYEVIGVNLKLFEAEKEFVEGGFSCCGLQSIEDARATCRKLGIPFYVLNYKEEFEEKVIRYFCREYENGRTPNPCIICNEKIKFGRLLEKAKSLEAEYIATGHYVRIKFDKKRERHLIKKGKDKKKDQSYFLFSLSQEQLKHSLFPLGALTKEEVRKLAKKFDLKVHSKPASQEICFIGGEDYRKFLTERIAPNKPKSCSIENTSGKVLGEHKGILFYTIGQRKGLPPYTKPLYVVGIDRERNAIIVGEEKELYQNELVIEKVNWIDRKKLLKPIKVKARIRYKQKESNAIVSPLRDGEVKVRFNEPQRAITPGQAVVFYKGETVVGGGWIV